MINPFGFLITIFYFKLAQKTKSLPVLKTLPPIVTAGIMLIATLEIFNINFSTYNESASYITVFLIPATIALGYPIYKHIELLKKNQRVIYTSFLTATLIAVISTYLIARGFHTELRVIESMLPKSVTAPIAVEISKCVGGIPELTACMVVMTGVFGAMFGHKILLMVKVKSDVAIGLAIGSASHVIGTARCIEKGNEKQMVMASVAFIMVGLLASLIIPLFLYLIAL